MSKRGRAKGTKVRSRKSVNYSLLAGRQAGARRKTRHGGGVDKVATEPREVHASAIAV